VARKPATTRLEDHRYACVTRTEATQVHAVRSDGDEYAGGWFLGRRLCVALLLERARNDQQHRDASFDRKHVGRLEKFGNAARQRRRMVRHVTGADSCPRSRDRQYHLQRDSRNGR